MRTENGYTEWSFYAYSVDRDMFLIKTDRNSDIKCIFLNTPAKWLKENMPLKPPPPKTTLNK